MKAWFKSLSKKELRTWIKMMTSPIKMEVRQCKNGGL